MISVKSKDSATPKLVQDLCAGDVAEIRYHKEVLLVYVFQQSKSDPRSMVDLGAVNSYWSDITNNTLEVIRVLKEGDTLTVGG